MPEPVQAVAAVQIILTPDGRVLTNFQGQATYALVLGMLEMAKEELLAGKRKRDAGSKLIECADPAMAVYVDKPGR